MWQEETKERELAFQIADRIICIQECDGGFDYSILDESYRLLDGGIYENLSMDIRYALLDIVDDLVTHPYPQGIKGSITSGAKWTELDFNEVTELMEKERSVIASLQAKKIPKQEKKNKKSVGLSVMLD